MRIFRLKSGLDAKSLHHELDRIDAIAVRCSAVSSTQELELAHHLAENSFSKEKNIARSMRYEFLLWLSGKTDIKSAMKASEPDGKEFFIIVFSKSESGDREPGTVCRMLSAEMLPLCLEKEGDPLALERISLSRIKG